jgi:cell wall-associated NlpC family hydrolase
MATRPSPAAAPSVRRDRHALTGPSVHLDPRLYPVRSDLTDVRLADRVFAPHYAQACERTALTAAPLRAATAAGAPILSELLPGDPFELFELSQTVAWGRSLVDGIVGYVDAATLGDAATPTHRVIEHPALLREAPDHNAVTLAAVPLGSRIASLGERGEYLLTAGGYIAKSSVRGIDQGVEGGVIAAAALLVGTPIRDGGRSGAGVDANGLIFLVHDLAGSAVPRLGDALTAALATTGAAQQAGNIVLFGAHPAIAVQGGDAVHAGTDRVVREPLAAIAQRLGAPTAQGRLA